MFYKLPNGICDDFASRIFSEYDQNYSTIDKEALRMTYAMTKFNFYINVKHFARLTNRKFLVSEKIG